MRAARSAQIQQSPAAAPHAPAPPREPAPTLRPAARHDAAAASPVHAMHDRLSSAFEAPRYLRSSRKRLDPVNLAIYAAAGLYIVAFWAGAIAVANTWLHHVAVR